MATLTTQTERWPVSTSGESRETGSRTRSLTRALWVVSVATTGMFLMAGGSNLAGAPQMVQMFDVIGLGQWFRFLTGAIEVVSAVALLLPPLALSGALALAATMIGAVLTHLLVIGGSPAPALTLLVATSFIAWTRWSRR
jgi:putative oxidoreductase